MTESVGDLAALMDAFPFVGFSAAVSTACQSDECDDPAVIFVEAGCCEGCGNSYCLACAWEAAQWVGYGSI